jgi:hypothetical protein
VACPASPAARRALLCAIAAGLPHLQKLAGLRQVRYEDDPPEVHAAYEDLQRLRPQLVLQP